MLIPLALFVSLLVATAFIAHWSDNLGKKLGKKRVSVFGLRPRTSATLLTVASSWCIMGFTLLALLGTVTPLRNALFFYQSERDKALEVETRLKGDALGLKDDIRLAQDDLKAAKKQTGNYQKQATTFQKDARRFEKQADRAQHDFQNAQRGEQDAKRAAQTASKQQQRAVFALTKAQSALGSSQSQLSQTQDDLKRNQEQVRRAEEDVNKANAELKQKQAQVKAAQAQVRATQAQIRGVRAIKERASAEAFKVGNENLKLERRNVGLEKQNVGLEKQRDQLQKDVAALRRDREQALFVANEFGQIAEGLAYEDIVLPINQTLAERRFDATRDPEEIARQLRILIDVARDTVTNPKTGIVPKAQFEVHARVADPTTNKTIDLDEKEAVQVYAKLLSSAGQSVSARLVSAFNYPESTTIIVSQLVFVPIRTIYIARENIAENTIDTNKSESVVFRQLNDLVDTARRNAFKRGSRPPLSPVDQNFFDGDTGQKLLDALREVRKTGHPVPVRIVAARDLDSAEPLQVRFLVGDQTA